VPGNQQADRTARRLRLLAARARVRQGLGGPRTQGEPRWLQINCSLFEQGAARPAYVPWAQLEAAVDGWRAEGRFDQFFFMRKPPGLRLRFRGPQLVATLEPALVAWLRDTEQRNLIRSFHFAVYEPEASLFGGPDGMDVAHDQFDRDTRLILRYEALTDASAVGLGRDELTLNLMHDLFKRMAEDQSELWDIWHRVWHAHGCPPLEPVAADRLERDRAQFAGDSLVAHELIETGRATNDHIACRLRAAASAGRLSCGLRAWLALACTFHWNRLGLSLEERLPLLASMLQLLDPHRVDR
jgi:thiopeptide-type bacteriocin biosynthesis protein